jgi:hypothetical protein
MALTCHLLQQFNVGTIELNGMKKNHHREPKICGALEDGIIEWEWSNIVWPFYPCRKYSNL